ncbi:MAG: poly-gamma-glutamate hydrolase family protein, partial [SAR324 cluster bacterium]|nr:poly-gamma-glutamate hydrolase family protein [SAR324 cluster bacterium]
MPDRYQNFNELSQNENAYIVEQNLVPNSTWLIAAPHGGNIESGTTEIARAISHACGSSYYSFIGKKEPDGGDLH